MSDNIKLVNELYSFANKNKILPRLIIKNNNHFDTLLNLIKNKFDEKLSIEEIYNSVISDDIEFDDIIIVYYISIGNKVSDDEFKQFIFDNLNNDIINVSHNSLLRLTPLI